MESSRTLTPEEELRNILGHLKRRLITDRDLGMEPPRLSEASLNYLDGRNIRVDSVDSLRRFIGDCVRCRLNQSRSHIIFGEGPATADFIFVGEGPDPEEDLQGRPFVGEAGALLTRIIQAMGLERDDVYLCNIVKCRTPEGRDPREDEMETCVPFLIKQIEIIQPKVVCTMGPRAGQGLLGPGFDISRERGEWRQVSGFPLMPTLHPAHLLKNPSAKRQVWEDIQKIMTHMGLEVKKNG